MTPQTFDTFKFDELSKNDQQYFINKLLQDVELPPMDYIDEELCNFLAGMGIFLGEISYNGIGYYIHKDEVVDIDLNLLIDYCIPESWNTNRIKKIFSDDNIHTVTYRNDKFRSNFDEPKCPNISKLIVDCLDIFNEEIEQLLNRYTNMLNSAISYYSSEDYAIQEFNDMEYRFIISPFRVMYSTY